MPSRKIIFDSPVKTIKELKEAIDLDFHMNLDNEREVCFGFKDSNLLALTLDWTS